MRKLLIACTLVALVLWFNGDIGSSAVIAPNTKVQKRLREICKSASRVELPSAGGELLKVMDGDKEKLLEQVLYFLSESRQDEALGICAFLVWKDIPEDDTKHVEIIFALLARHDVSRSLSDWDPKKVLQNFLRYIDGVREGKVNFTPYLNLAKAKKHFPDSAWAYLFIRSPDDAVNVLRKSVVQTSDKLRNSVISRIKSSAATLKTSAHSVEAQTGMRDAILQITREPLSTWERAYVLGQANQLKRVNCQEIVVAFETDSSPIIKEMLKEMSNQR